MNIAMCVKLLTEEREHGNYGKVREKKSLFNFHRGIQTDAYRVPQKERKKNSMLYQGRSSQTDGQMSKSNMKMLIGLRSTTR